MRIKLNQLFTKRYPGPFIVTPGNDWFDATFDIICLESDERIVSTYYWDKEEESQAKTTAEVVAAALNQTAGHPAYLLQNETVPWHSFQRERPGPYILTKSHCPGRGRFMEVVCKTTAKSVIQCYDIASWATPKQLAIHIADALNTSLEDPQACATAKQAMALDGVVT